MFKQVLSLATALLLTVGFVACTTDEPEPEIIDNSENDDPDSDTSGPLTLKLQDAGEKKIDLFAAEPTSEYFVTAMKNGAAEDPVNAEIKILTEQEFAHYKELAYGSSDFQGIVKLNSEFFTIQPNEQESNGDNAVYYTFKSKGSDYCVAKIVLDNQRMADWRKDLEYRARQANENEVEKMLAQDTLNNMTFVVPIGLFSENFDNSISDEDRYLILTPEVKNAVISVSLGNDEALIVEQYYEQLVDAASDYRRGSFGQELVKFSLPCANPYGFRIKFNNNPDIDIARFNGHHRDMVLTQLLRFNDKRELNYSLGINNKVVDYIDFPAGKTEVWLPIEFFRSQIDAEDFDHNFATSIQLAGLNWRLSNAPVNVQNAIKLPESYKTWYATGNGDDGHYSGYTFFVGYRVALTPLPLDGSSIIGANDPELTEGSFEALFDDDPMTFYHSAWSDGSRKDRTEKYGSYIDIEVPTKELINAFALKFTSRVHANPHSPKVVKLYYSNGKTEAEREATWEPILRAGYDQISVNPNPLRANAGSGQVTWVGNVRTDSDWIKAKEPFRYLRMCVIENSLGETLTSIGTKNFGYWNLGELRLYGKKL